MTMETYSKLRDSGKSLEEIQNETSLSESTIWTFELGYYCYLSNIALDEAVEIIKNSTW